MGSEKCCQFESIGNFRRIPLTNMFRSARPDKLCQSEFDKFADLKLGAIYDLRSLREYPFASGAKLVDDVYQPTIVKALPNSHDIQFTMIDKTGKKGQVVDSVAANNPHTNLKFTGEAKSHFVFDLLSKKYIRAVIRQSPWRYRVFIYLFALLQRIFGGFFFQKLIVHFAINYYGLLGQYKHTIDFCGAEICAVMRVMCEPQNVPGLVCCAHGKDRTGIISALIMALSGADKHTVALEYNKTEEYQKSFSAELNTTLQRYGLHESFRNAKYSDMVSLMEHIEDKYGSVPGYLLSIGFDMEDQKRLLTNIAPHNI